MFNCLFKSNKQLKVSEMQMFA